MFTTSLTLEKEVSNQHVKLNCTSLCGVEIFKLNKAFKVFDLPFPYTQVSCYNFKNWLKNISQTVETSQYKGETTHPCICKPHS